MTPKKRAKLLVGQYYEKISDDMNFYSAKQCALIAVDEILKEYSVLAIETSFCYKMYLFWKEVEKEIENL
jgi:hypothetical protein